MYRYFYQGSQRLLRMPESWLPDVVLVFSAGSVMPNAVGVALGLLDGVLLPSFADELFVPLLVDSLRE